MVFEVVKFVATTRLRAKRDAGEATPAKDHEKGTASLDASGSLLLLRLERKKISSTPLNFRFSYYFSSKI